MNKIEIGATLKAEREAQGLTQYKAGIPVEVYRHQIEGIENGDNNYRINTLMAYANRLGYELTLVKNEK